MRDSQDCGECCKKLLANWISTSHGPNPKTYQTLVAHVKKNNKLIVASEAIAEELSETIEGNNFNSDII